MAIGALARLLPGRDAADPLTHARSAAHWLRQQPPLDVVERQLRVMRAFEGMRQSRRAPDLHRAGAITWLDSALAGDRRQLMKQYVENVENSANLATRLWQALHELTQGFLYAYQACLDEALAQPSSGKWRTVLPLLFVRLIHYHGTDAKLRVFRLERWIPGRWQELHKIYRVALDMGVDRIPASLPDAGTGHADWSAEQEFIYVCLLHQLNTGNLTPVEMDWASAQLRAWCRRLTLEGTPGVPDGFVVDLDGKGGLVRRSPKEPDTGETLRYLDSRPLLERLERAVAALGQGEPGASAAAALLNRQRVAILERLRPAIAPTLDADLRRSPRIPVRISADVIVGLSRICRRLSEPAAAGADDGVEHIELRGPASLGPVGRPFPREDDYPALPAFSDPGWHVRDRSVAGVRLAITGGGGQGLQLGALVAIRQEDLDQWVVGVVRRVSRASKEESEAGVAIIGQRIVPVTLNARREPGGLGMEVNGLDASTFGARFDGIYLPPPSRPDKPINAKTLIVPTSEYLEGRKIILSTERSVYTIALRHAIEQRPDWTWVLMQILEKVPRLEQ